MALILVGVTMALGYVRKYIFSKRESGTHESFVNLSWILVVSENTPVVFLSVAIVFMDKALWP